MTKDELARLGFTSKKQATEYVRTIVARTPDGGCVGEHDRAFLFALFSHHPKAVKKLAGAVAVRVRTNGAFGQKPTRGFWLVRADGSEVDISWTECLTPTAPDKRAKQAFRHHIDHQVVRLRRRTFPWPETTRECPLSGRLITSSEAEIDHAAPDTFEALVADFLAERRLRLADVVTVSSGYSGVCLADPHLAREWEEFHGENAILRAVCKQRIGA